MWLYDDLASQNLLSMAKIGFSLKTRVCPYVSASTMFPLDNTPLNVACSVTLMWHSQARPVGRSRNLKVDQIMLHQFVCLLSTYYKMYFKMLCLGSCSTNRKESCTTCLVLNKTVFIVRVTENILFWINMVVLISRCIA